MLLNAYKIMIEKAKKELDEEGYGLPYHLREAGDMIEPTIKLFEKHDTDKAFRWFGFIQGVLYSSGAYSIPEIKGHNK